MHCNQSSIEGLLSHIRMMGKDRTDLYGCGIFEQNISRYLKVTLNEIKSASYPQELIGEESNDWNGNKVFSIDTLCSRVDEAYDFVNSLAKRHLNKKMNSNNTYILPRDNKKNLTKISLSNIIRKFFF